MGDEMERDGPIMQYQLPSNIYIIISHYGIVIIGAQISIHHHGLRAQSWSFRR